MPIAPPGPGEVVIPKSEPSVSNMIERFKAAKDGDALSKPAPKPAAIAPVAPPVPAPAPAPKPADGSIVPKLEPFPEKKVEAPPTLAPEPAKGEALPEKLSHKNFKEVLASRDEFKNKWESESKRAREFEAKLQEQGTRTPPELEEAKKQLAEYQQREQQFYLERSPEFKKAFDGRIETAITDAKESVDVSKASELEEILRAPAGEWRNKRFREFVSALDDDIARGDLRDAYSKLKTAQRERQDELTKASENIKALEQLHSQRAAEQSAKQKEGRERLAQYALDVATKSLAEFRETEDLEHNTAVADNKAMLQKFLTDDLPPDEFGRMAIWAVRGYRSLATEKVLSDKVAMLEAEIAKLSSASPDLDGGGGSQQDGEKADTPEKAGARFQQAITTGIPGR